MQLPLAGQSDTDEVTKGKDHAKLKKTKQNSTANLPQKIASKPRQDGQIAKIQLEKLIKCTLRKPTQCQIMGVTTKPTCHNT